MALRGSDPISVTDGRARHRAPRPGRFRRIYALAVVLVVIGAFGWELWGETSFEPSNSDSEERAVHSAQTSPTAHQRTVTDIVGPDTIRVVEHLDYTAPTDVVVLENPERLGPGARFTLVIEDLWADSGTGPRPVADPPATGEAVRIQLPGATTAVTVGYRATGVVERTASPVTGRALGLVTPLRLKERSAGLRTVDVHGEWIESLGCVDRSGRMTACGHASSLWWATSAEDAQLVDVIAQLTLPSG